MRITILNWDKYNTRKDVKNPNWFALSNKLFFDPEFNGFSHSELLCWVYVLCECSRNNKKGTVTINPVHTYRVSGIDEVTLKVTLKKLKELHIITHDMCRTRTQSVQNPNVHVRNPYATITIQDNTNTIAAFTNTNKLAVAFAPDFESLYKSYPLKKGKSRGLKQCAKEIRTQDDFELLTKAVLNYSTECLRLNTESRFIKHFSSFMSEWRDWIDYKPDERTSVKKLPSAPTVTSAY